ncbi:hypothetical protein THRCLA_22926 [Thraustotheca clavata]|uniref:Uncharacterized protein n=1 Tax=Thraustotheca clavata TaxID=74557 RepID=A0A1V9YNC3_9STRA|nr:hypothetical protein THRCLA_22926 [Thraustotheca clavata]
MVAIEVAFASQQIEIVSFLLVEKCDNFNYKYATRNDGNVWGIILFVIRRDNVDLYLIQFFDGKYDHILSHTYCNWVIMGVHHTYMNSLAMKFHIISYTYDGAEFTIKAMDLAASYGKFNIVKFLHKEGCTVQAMDKTAANNHLNVVEFLHANRTEGCTQKALLHAIHHQYTEMIKLLVSKSPRYYYVWCIGHCSL